MRFQGLSAQTSLAELLLIIQPARQNIVHITEVIILPIIPHAFCVHGSFGTTNEEAVPFLPKNVT